MCAIFEIIYAKEFLTEDTCVVPCVLWTYFQMGECLGKCHSDSWLRYITLFCILGWTTWICCRYNTIKYEIHYSKILTRNSFYAIVIWDVLLFGTTSVQGCHLGGKRGCWYQIWLSLMEHEPPSTLNLIYWWILETHIKECKTEDLRLPSQLGAHPPPPVQLPLEVEQSLASSASFCPSQVGPFVPSW